MFAARHRLVLGLGILLACTATATASEDDKMYPGASCQTSASGDSIARTSNGGMFNSGNTFQVWTCPIIRDNNANASLEFARVTVSNLGGNVSCTIFSKTSTGSTVGSALGVRNGSTITFGAGDGNVVAVVTGGYAYFRCTVPGGGSLRSGVVTYTVTENVGED